MTVVANFTCVGNRYRQSHEVDALEGMQSGDQVQLQLDPGNKHDPMAIKVMSKDTLGEYNLHLGFVPRTENVYIGGVLGKYKQLELPITCTFHSGILFVVTV